MSCCEPAWTCDDLAAINAAIAMGATRVKYADREVSYASITDMMRVRRLIMDSLGCSDGNSLAAGRTYGAYSKGLC